MRKLSLIVAICSAVISAPTMAQNVTYACQYTDSGGLDWEKKRWNISKYNLKRPFFILAQNSKLNVESVGKVLVTNPIRVHCHDAVHGTQACSDYLGGSFIFDFNHLNGGVSQIFGASSSDTEGKKDSIVVYTFTCTKM